ncbi:MAG: DUF2141 domain-containing protein [Sphingomonadales bacterium]
MALAILITVKALPVAAEGSGKTPPNVRQEGTCGGSDTRPEILVRIKGIRNDEGNLRVNVYNDKPGEFLAKGKKIVRVDMPTQSGSMDVCVRVPKEGTYALVVLHDRNANGKVNPLSDGMGASNDTGKRMRKPKHHEAAFTVGPGRTELDVTVRYLFRKSEK